MGLDIFDRLMDSLTRDTNDNISVCFVAHKTPSEKGIYSKMKKKYFIFRIGFLREGRRIEFWEPKLSWNYIHSLLTVKAIAWVLHALFVIGIKHGFSCINIRQVSREVLKTEAGGRGFQHLPRDLASVNALKNHVRSLFCIKTENIC